MIAKPNQMLYPVVLIIISEVLPMSQNVKESRYPTFLRLAGVSGILGATLPLTMVLLATFLSSWFSWNANALSELGVGTEAALFNSAMLLGGTLNFLFATGLLEYFGKKSYSEPEPF